MPARKAASPLTSGSDLARVDAHRIRAGEYDELPELDTEMLARAVVKRAGRPTSANPKRPISLRLPADVLERWKATGPGWQTRMAERLARVK
ncbi:MAG: BrnA antitoxin family protein [Caldimonas sp.]